MGNDKSKSYEKLWNYYQHADNLHSGRINFFLVIETLLIGGFLQGGQKYELILAIAGLLITFIWYWVNFRLQCRMDWLTCRLKEEDSIYKGYIEDSVGFKRLPSKYFLTYILPLMFFILWGYLLQSPVSKQWPQWPQSLVLVVLATSILVAALVSWAAKRSGI